MVLRKVEGAGDGGGWIGSEGGKERKVDFTEGKTGRSNSRARIARLGRRRETEGLRKRERERERGKKGNEDALKTESSRNEIIILRWIERGPMFFGTW